MNDDSISCSFSTPPGMLCEACDKLCGGSSGVAAVEIQFKSVKKLGLARLCAQCFGRAIIWAAKQSLKETELK